MISKKKFLSAILAISIVAALAIGGTLAYLTATTKTVSNTFTVGKIEATLDEKDVANPDSNTRVQENDYKIVPGDSIEKDPTVHILEKSEKCFVFVCIDDGLNAAVDGSAVYTVDTSTWTKVGDTKNGRSIYKSAEVDASAAQKNLIVFNGVTINGSVVNEDNMPLLDGKKIIVNAYAHQSKNVSAAVAEEAALDYFDTIDNPNGPVPLDP